jgi:hypothetical protein
MFGLLPLFIIHALLKLMYTADFASSDADKMLGVLIENRDLAHK